MDKIDISTRLSNAKSELYQSVHIYLKTQNLYTTNILLLMNNFSMLRCVLSYTSRDNLSG